MTGNISLRRIHHIILLISLSTELTGGELTDSIFPTHCSSSSIQTSCQLLYVNRRSFSIILFLFRFPAAALSVSSRIVANIILRSEDEWVTQKKWQCETKHHQNPFPELFGNKANIAPILFYFCFLCGLVGFCACTVPVGLIEFGNQSSTVYYCTVLLLATYYICYYKMCFLNLQKLICMI